MFEQCNFPLDVDIAGQTSPQLATIAQEPRQRVKVHTHISQSDMREARLIQIHADQKRRLETKKLKLEKMVQLNNGGYQNYM